MLMWPICSLLNTIMASELVEFALVTLQLNSDLDAEDSDIITNNLSSEM